MAMQSKGMSAAHGRHDGSDRNVRSKYSLSSYVTISMNSLSYYFWLSSEYSMEGSLS